MEPSIVKIADLEPHEVRPGVTRRVFHSDRMTWIRYTYATGSVFPSHAHPEEQITLVLEGSIEFVVEGRTVVLGPGEAAVIPPGTPHSARVVGRGAVVTDNVLAPRREAEIRVLE